MREMTITAGDESLHGKIVFVKGGEREIAGGGGGVEIYIDSNRDRETEIQTGRYLDREIGRKKGGGW